MAHILNEWQPHTRRPNSKPDSLRPTCSQPTEHNKGCEQWHFCQFGAPRDNSTGPFQLAVIDHRDCEPSAGRRIAVWCFNACRLFFGEAPKAGFSVAVDRAYVDQVGKTRKVVKLAKPEDQGPYYWPAQSASTAGDRELLANASADDPSDDGSDPTGQKGARRANRKENTP